MASNQKWLHYLFYTVFITVFFFQTAVSANSTSNSAISKALQKFEKYEGELGQAGSISEGLLGCSYIQDAWLTFLQQAENEEEYHHGMRLLNDYTHSFKSICRYTSSVINFYTGDKQYAMAQEVPVNFHGIEVLGFLNTFKKGCCLTPEERELYFEQERSHYLRDKVVEPFILDATSIQELEPERIYNFALLPDGTIYAALEKTGETAYHVCADETVSEAFQYPNHTILAGSPHQVVVTAGSFILYQVDNKRLFFISCKSGHFVPNYYSLNYMRYELTNLGVDPYTVIETPDVDLSRVVLKIYNRAQVPVALCQHDAEQLFSLARERWQSIYQTIDRKLLTQLSQGNFNQLNGDLIQQLNKQREEATYMRSAYHLFSSSHEAPKNFHKLVKRFGKLKDAIKHQAMDRIPIEANKLLLLMDQYESESALYPIEIADDASLYSFLSDMIADIKRLLTYEKLSVHDYHHLKKSCREISVLFDYMAQRAKWKERGFFIYSTTAEAFLQVNESLAKAHDAYIYQLMHGKLSGSEDFFIQTPSKTAYQIDWYFNHLGIAPPVFSFEIQEKPTWWMINWAKRWYESHYYYLHKNETFIKVLDAIQKDLFDCQQADHTDVLALMKRVKRDAELSKNALLLLDIRHEVPEEIADYLAQIEQLITCAENGSQASPEAIAKFREWSSHAAVPTFALENWKCSDRDSFQAILKSYMEDLLDIQIGACLSLNRAKEIKEHVQAIQDLMYLYKRNGLIRREDDLPTVCYDLIEEHAMQLVEELEARMISTSEVTISSEMALHAKVIFSKVAFDF